MNNSNDRKVGIGDEFGIIMPETTEEDSIKKLEGLRNTIGNSYFTGEELAGEITASIGVCHTKYATDARTLRKYADLALYKGRKK